MTDQLTTPETTHEGSTRRDFLRRSAIVGGTLVWAAPTVQSMAPAAYAQTAGSPKDFSYIALCLDCGGGAFCCVKFDLTEDPNDPVEGFTSGPNFNTPNCSFTNITSPNGCTGVDLSDFDVVFVGGTAQTVEITVKNTLACTIVAGSGVGKCGNPPSNGECVTDPVISNGGKTITFSMCGP